MHYADSECCPSTFEAYRARVIQNTDLPIDAAKRILREHDVAGRSKMRSWEIRSKAEEIDPSASLEARSDGARLYRWLVAHGLELTYGELAEIEAEAGVEIVDDETSRGTYGSYDDVERVYAIGVAHRTQMISTAIRLPYETERDTIAADEIIRALDDVFGISCATTFSGKYGGRFIAADVLVPLK